MTRGSKMAMVAMLSALLVACESKPASPPKPFMTGWRPIGAWSGHGNSQTESFNIETGQWRIKWETRNGDGAFRVMVHSAVSGRPLQLAVEHRGAGHDTAYISEDPRLFHLVIESKDLDWSVTVEEGVQSRQGSTPP